MADGHLSERLSTPAVLAVYALVGGLLVVPSAWLGWGYGLGMLAGYVLAALGEWKVRHGV